MKSVMNLNNGITSVRNITLVELTVLIIVGLAVTVLVENLLVKVAGVFCFMTGFTGFFVVFNKDKFLPVPFKVKKWIIMNIILKIEIMFATIFKMNTEAIMQYFIFLNNRLNPDGHGKKILLLLPRCIQEATCTRDLTLDIKNCLRCGRCQIADILKIVEPKDLEVRLVGGGTLALEKVSQINPEGIISVACERELIDGIKETLHIPVWALKNLRPNGPCLNTKIQLEKLVEIIDRGSREERCQMTEEGRGIVD